MSAWTSEELDAVGAADELELTASGKSVTIWVVRAGNELYVRSSHGRYVDPIVSADARAATLKLVPRRTG
jgi:hypothetical protein